MRLQRLEIAGFKSFPDRSELTFDTGVTAIVGPNGCGKSNVVDALTWVLGEQSAKSLRGDRMEDVIFGGSDARRPTAAAEVRLKLSGVAARVPGLAGVERRKPGPDAGHGKGNGNGNGSGHGHAHALSEGTGHEGTSLGAGDGGVAVMTPPLEDETPLIVRDIELMRRLYRSGESEYLIDGEICRLRDVQDLLMDAGLGVKGYAVIEQGKIGQILSARPTDRRQLIEEAAGVTKYKSRRRAAELKLEAAQQNLTRVDDIVFEVEKQRGALKRQAAKARRYRRLRDELRRWEKVQFAQRYRMLGAAIESARGRLAEAREREAAAAAQLSGMESGIEALRLDLAEADSAETAAREQAHARELAVGRLQQQIAFDRHQIETLGTTVRDIEAEVATLEARREPARIELEARREAAATAAVERDQAAGTLAAEEGTYSELQTRIEGLESDVEAARSEVFAAVNAATALRHAVEHAAAAQARIGEQIAKLEVEGRDLAVEAERAAQERAQAEAGLQRAVDAMEELRTERASREAELAAARGTRDARAHAFRTGEQQIAALSARLTSLEELDAARAEYGDGARLVLAESNGDVGQLGSVADYLEVASEHERAVEAALGELLQHVVVRTHAQAEAGLRFVSDRDAGRVGFLIAESDGPAPHAATEAPVAGLTRLADVVAVSGPASAAISAAIANCWIAESAEAGRLASPLVGGPIATSEGLVFRSPWIVEGGARAEARGILATKREIKELRERVEVERTAVGALREEIDALQVVMTTAESAIGSLQQELHSQEKAVVGFEMQSASAVEAAERVSRKQEQIALERRKAEEDLRAQEARQQEARESISRIEIEQRSADDRLNGAQRRLFETREEMQAQARRTAEAKAAHAGLLERAAALAAEVERLADAGRELEERVTTRRDELGRAEARREALQGGIAAAEIALDEGVREFDALRESVRTAEERCQSLRTSFDESDGRVREARRALEGIRAEAAQLDVARATAEADLTHLAAACIEAVQVGLDEVAAEVEALEREGLLARPRPVDDTPEPSEFDGDAEPAEARVAADAPAVEDEPGRAVLTADEMVLDLRAKIDRMGPVNILAIDQFDELEARHTFLTTQRKDLIDAIAATGEAIRRIDKTTRERFSEAFTAINYNFERTFSTLFGGGRAGLVLLDESDALESGIDIIAQPPGKRLQSVQLLSGGEKALTAMALMFAIFQYRPSPFCLLDEIDAPLDDANIGRFVEMLQGMQDHTQFILITHNRKTMEIADRLYGVTMEEPGVSKLISVQLN